MDMIYDYMNWNLEIKINIYNTCKTVCILCYEFTR